MLIDRLDFAGYFLTVWDIVRFARSQNILCQGRGSAANSVVCYCLGITSIDPIRMSLLFERFISAERGEPPGQADFIATAARVDPAKPAADVWRGVLANHPKRGDLVAAAQKAVDDLFAFIAAKRLVDVPAGARVKVAAAPPYDLGLASMHSSPPLEPNPILY